MIVLLQRVTQASVSVAGAVVGQTGPGFLALVCAEPGDTDEAVRKAAQKTVKLRVFEDEAGKMNRAIRDTGGSILAVPQFTLAADCMSGNRPSFSRAAPPEEGLQRFNDFVAALRSEGVAVETGEFGAEMQVSLVNDGPATFWLKF